MIKRLDRMGIHWFDILAFVPFALIYTAFGVFWTTSSARYMAGDPIAGLQIKKDIMYYLLWFCASSYAIIANTIVLWNRAPRGGLIAFVVMLGAMVATFAGMTLLTGVLNDIIPASTKVLSIAIGDLLVLLPLVTASVVFVIAWIVAGFSNHLREQPVLQGLSRLGIALMVMPVIQFMVIYFLPRWDDEVRGVVFVHAMSLGLMWGLFLGGGLAANMRRRNGNGAAVPAKQA
ncbi:MAG: hypothetical protein H0T53_02500 [Herpetosiphonaceae bacterium]|nr:hypothetical protein [Herpetosiphonaceae bacterium]